MAGPKRPRRHRRVREAPASRYTSKGTPESSAGVAGVLFGSDVIIEILRGRATVVEAARALESAGVATFGTAVAWAEIHAGLLPAEEPVTQAFCEARGEVMLDARAGRRAGTYPTLYGRSRGVEIADALVAATAGLHLWTLNRKHCPMPDVRFYTA